MDGKFAVHSLRGAHAVRLSTISATPTIKSEMMVMYTMISEPDILDPEEC